MRRSFCENDPHYGTGVCRRAEGARVGRGSGKLGGAIPSEWEGSKTSENKVHTLGKNQGQGQAEKHRGGGRGEGRGREGEGPRGEAGGEGAEAQDEGAPVAALAVVTLVVFVGLAVSLILRRATANVMF